MWGTTNRVGPSSGRWGDFRAQSAPLAVVLVFGMVIAGSTLVVLVGGHAISETETQLGADQAEKVMTQFDSQAAMVALGASNVQSVTLPNSQGFSVDNDSGWVTVEYENYGTGSTEKIVDQHTFGAITAEHGDQKIAYQGGGVWVKTDSGSKMVSPPEFHYRDATLTFPIITVSGDSSIDRKVTVTPNRTVQYYPNESMNSEFTNPLTNGKVAIRIQSDYYEAWGRYFETRTEGDVDYDHANQQIEVMLVVPSTNPPVNGGLVTAPGGKLVIKNHAEADSYNSSDGPYSSYPDGDGTAIVVDAPVEVGNHAEIYGDIVASGTVSVKNHGRIHGNVSHQGLSNSGTIDGWEAPNASISSPSAVDSVIRARIDSYQATNNNADPSVDVDESSNRLENCDSTCTLTAGNYYLDEIDLAHDDELHLDTSGGDINIAVDGDVYVNGENPADTGQEIRVTGPGRANVYVGEDVTFSQQAATDVDGDRASGFWLFTKTSKEVEFQSHSRLEGVVYGPGGSGFGTTITIKNHAEVFGALVGRTDFVSNHYSIHYDEALAKEQPVTTGNSIPALTYLHISTNDVNVTSG